MPFYLHWIFYLGCRIQHRPFAYIEKNLLPDFTNNDSFARDTLRVDFQALGLLEYSREHVSEDVQPILTRGDDNWRLPMIAEFDEKNKELKDTLESNQHGDFT